MGLPDETEDRQSDTAASGPISAFGEAQPPTDAERYRWICANRLDIALHDALRTAHSDHDFDDQIDAAIRARREGDGQGGPQVTRATKPFGRRRSDYE